MTPCGPNSVGGDVVKLRVDGTWCSARFGGIDQFDWRVTPDEADYLRALIAEVGQ